MNKLWKDFNIKHRLTPLYTPQMNPVERDYRTMKSMISQYCEGNHRKWDQHIGESMIAENSANHESTRFTPAYVNFGHELRLPVPSVVTEDAQEAIADVAVTDEEAARAYSERLARLRETFELVRTNLRSAYESQKRYYDLRRRE